MSADNWAHCPCCTSVALAEFEAREAAVQASYGVVPVDEFDAARKRLADDKAAFERREPTFREDYEISGAEEGVISVSYSGRCRKCGLNLSFADEHPIPGFEATA